MTNKMKFAFHNVSKAEQEYVNGDFIVWVATEYGFANQNRRIIPCYVYDSNEFGEQLFDFMVDHPNGIIEFTDRIGNTIIIE